MDVRLYIAEATPNSIRAEVNLRAALEQLEVSVDSLRFEIIDVFSQPRRALREGVIVTPTLIVSRGAKTSVTVGDLSNRTQLEGLLGSPQALPQTI
jgi:circadian clock protein KaiB